LEDRTVIQFGSPGSLRGGVRLNGMYEIETLLAQGGMGEVYKGFNIQTRDLVAIKMILPELARNEDVFALFRREATTLHNLQHEAIVRYFVFSVDPDLQRAYLAMEFVDGPSLTKRLAQGPLSIVEANILRKRIAGALEAAHRVGVIHRDISPDNIILPGNDPRRAKIVDFGIARSQRPGEGTLLGGGFAGKYNYVAPEQLGLAGGDVTARSDIYSFGLVLAEALRGRPIDMSGTQVQIIEKRRTVPDLSDIDASMRPLLQAMLAPLPADRPESMAAVASWDENGKTSAKNRIAASSEEFSPRTVGSPLGEKPGGGITFGRLAAILGVLILISVVGGTLYLFRDAMPWNDAATVPREPTTTAKENRADNPAPPAEPAVPSGSMHKLPPLPDPAPSQAIAASTAPVTDASKPSVADAIAPAPPGQPAPHVPTADEIVQSFQTSASRQSNSDDVHSGAEGAAPLLKLTPPSVAEMKSELAQPPQTAAAVPPSAPAAAPVARPSAAAPTPALAPPAIPPHAPQSVVAMDDAVVGHEYLANLPPFSDSGNLKALVLHAEPDPPAGLAFADLGSGFSQISGKPTTPGQYSFEILARNAAGATARMTTRINVAAASDAAPATPTALAPNRPPAGNPSPPNEIVASLTPAGKSAGFLRDFDGGPCFFARSLGGSSDSLVIQGIGSDKATFERFYGDFIRETGIEPVLNVRLIRPAECPVIDLIRASGGEHAEGPKIELVGYDVGRGKPLAGTISNIAGRHLDVLLLDSDGNVYRIDTRVQQGGANATFNIPITPDATSVGALQLVLAITSPKQLSSLSGFKAGAAAVILPNLHNELSAASGTLEVEFFKLVK
jgi:serine/threonine protein kinase